MTRSHIRDLVWWVIPGVLGGMPMPFIVPERRLQTKAGLREFEDDLPVLYDGGVRSVVCLLNIPSDRTVYRSAGFEFLCSPIRDCSVPSLRQVARIVAFLRSAPRASVVHCEAGLGRTGTILAAYGIMARGMTPDASITEVRHAEPAAIESPSQMAFLYQLHERRMKKVVRARGST